MLHMKPLRGPFPLNYEVVTREVAAPVGAFALGYTCADGRFCANKVGRSDGDLLECLTRSIGSEREFKYLPLASIKECFEAECRLFHSLAPVKTRSHPKRRGGSHWMCPVCAARPLKLPME
jgi:hypothetical protein